MESLTKLELTFTTALGILIFASSCSTPTPTIKYENTSCDESRILDLEPGDIVDLTDVGNKNDFIITLDGKIYVPGVSNKITDPNAVDYIIGDKDKPPYYVVKSTGTGNGDVSIKKVCPIKPATPTPQPSPTPYSYLGKGSGKLASLPPGFHPNVKASKPVRVFRRRG
jgi:hypothetical protein